MKTPSPILFVAAAFLLATACGGPADQTGGGDETGSVEAAVVSSWTQLGAFSKTTDQPTTSVAYLQGKLWAAAGNTVQVRTSTGYWKQALSATYDVVALGASPSYVFAGVTYDGAQRGSPSGSGWTPVGTELWPVPDAFAYDSASSALYADLQGATARSLDQGSTWEVVAPGDAWYGCQLATAPAGGRLYQSCQGYWGGWVGAVDVSNQTASQLSPVVLVDGGNFPSRWFPSAMAVSRSDGLVYAGMNGGVVWIDGADWGWVYDSEEPVTFSAIWIDPNNANHLVFGGVDYQRLELVLYETWNRGQTTTRNVAPSKLALNNPSLKSFTASGTAGERLVLSVETGGSSRVTSIIEVVP